MHLGAPLPTQISLSPPARCRDACTCCMDHGDQPQPLAVAEQEWHSSPKSNAAGQKRSTEQQTASQVRLGVFKNTSALIIATETFSSGVKHVINTSACWRGDV